MLVVHVVHSLAIGGLENGILNLVNAPRRDQCHAVICMTGGGANRGRVSLDVPVVELGKSEGHDVRTFSRLVRLLRRLRPDIVHSRNWATFDAVVAARLARVPVVVHGEHGREFSDPEGRNLRRNRLRRFLAPLVNRFVAVSEDLRRWLVQDVGIPASKVVRIHNGVDTGCYVPGDPGPARDALDLPSSRPVVGTVGRLNPVKDQAGLVRAFARVRSEYPDALLVIAGEGPCRDELRGLVVSLRIAPHVRFLGERHDVPTILRAFDVFVLPSIAEGISNTILEAMAVGLPVVATRVGGNSELVEEGVTGHLVPRSDPEALASAIGTYLGDANLRALHGKRSRDRAVSTFRLELMRDSYGDLYSSLVGARQAMRFGGTGALLDYAAGRDDS
jgi:sugar transferase (PEP-CTERM/EpsH1 system associated)